MIATNMQLLSRKLWMQISMKWKPHMNPESVSKGSDVGIGGVLVSVCCPCLLCLVACTSTVPMQSKGRGSHRTKCNLANHQSVPVEVSGNVELFLSLLDWQTNEEVPAWILLIKSLGRLQHGPLPLQPKPCSTDRWWGLRFWQFKNIVVSVNVGWRFSFFISTEIGVRWACNMRCQISSGCV